MISRAAKMEGLPTYYGNPVSEHAERNLRLVGIGRVLALTPNMELNALAAQHYRLEFRRQQSLHGPEPTAGKRHQ